ncbi:hypothetical protein GCM10007887_16260 [Methylobacterium haplocladii]|uniref:Uncharacterized protein n=1 Tax=Methylobacterium haplocladii TaxID=1176176 RepID=A0A512IMV2_9HYPH|nr:hypothetical protein MHA02_14280 [Methylobacterium haplocladii]GLS58960.1 hypothetical protein GCM10007887_16260 [Methylobacterium haplocladii]
MTENADAAGPDAAELCAQAREVLGTEGSFRVRVLLDMVLIELARETVASVSPPRSDSPDGS